MIRALTVASLLASLTLPLSTGCSKDVKEKLSTGAQLVGEGLADSAKGAWDSTKEGARLVGNQLSADATAVADSAADTWITTKVKTKIGVTQMFGVSVTTEKKHVTLAGKGTADDGTYSLNGLAPQPFPGPFFPTTFQLSSTPTG